MTKLMKTINHLFTLEEQEELSDMLVSFCRVSNDYYSHKASIQHMRSALCVEAMNKLLDEKYAGFRNETYQKEQ